MKFGRRAFLQFAAGAVGGTLLSPMPWRLADDTAIWSQNWSWRPSPERGPITTVPTVCTLCQGGCGIQARLVNGNRAIFLEGNPVHPVNAGGICPLGAAALQYLYAPYRIEQPMKQTRARGEAAGFQPISWSEALDDLVKRLARLKSEGTPGGVACITGSRWNSMDDLWARFFSAYGSPGLFKMPSHSDSLRATAKLALGKDSPLAFALENASYVLSFGAALVEGWGAPARMQAAFMRWQKNGAGKGAAKLVQVESRCSMSAAKADQWVPVVPGTEALLALGIAHVMVKENLYDADFVSRGVLGFEDWTDMQGKVRSGFKKIALSAAYAPDQVAARTGVDAAKIQGLAREFASTANAVAVWGGGQHNVPGNIYHEMSFFALNVLRGNLKSGGLVSLVPDVPFQPADDQTAASAEGGAPQVKLGSVPGTRVPLPGNGIYGFLDILTRGMIPPLEVLFVHDANPAYSLPENKIFKAALDKVGYVVSMSPYMDETAMTADLILPNHAAFEGFEDVVGLPGVPYAYYAVSRPILKPRKDTKHSGDVVLQLSKALGGNVAAALPWASYEEYLKNRVNALAASKRGAVADKKDIDLSRLQSSVSVSPNFKDGTDLWKKLTGGFCWYDVPVDVRSALDTDSGKIELAFRAIQGKGLNVEDDQVYLPHFKPLPPSGDEKEYPLLLLSYGMLSLSCENLANPPFMTKTLWDFVLKKNDLFVEVNPSTAGPLGMSEGSKAVLKTPQGEVAVRVHLSQAARPGAIYMPQGLGHTAYDEYIQGKGVNSNSVVEVQVDPITGMGTVWATRAQLRRA